MKLTQIILAIVIVALLGYEGWTLANAAPNDTISEAVWNWFDTTPAIGFLSGVLCGHWFWPRTNCKQCAEKCKENTNE